MAEAVDLPEFINEDQQIETFDKRLGTTGALSGPKYEIKLSMLFLLEGIIKKEINDFYLAANMDGVGDFDDVVFKYFYNENGRNKTKIIFLQAKHRDSMKIETINFDSLLSQTDKGDFLLRKYLGSYIKIRQRFDLDDSNYYIYTNAMLDFNEGYEIDQNNILYLKEDAQYFKIKYSENVKRALENSLDFEILIKELVKSVSNKTINGNIPIFKDYKKTLLKNVIVINNFGFGKFRATFLSNEKDALRNTFLDEISKKKIFGELMGELKDLEIKLNANFGNVEERELELELPSKLIKDKEIKIFLEELRIFGNQYNEKQLEENIIKKIQSAYLVNEEDANTIFSKVYKQVEIWWKSNVYLRKTNNFFESAKQDVSKTSLVGLASVRRAEIKNQKIIFTSEHVKTLRDLILKNQVLNISTINTILTSAKVYQALESIPTHSEEYNNNDKYIFINSVLDIQNKLIDSFKSENNNLLVFEYKSGEKNLQNMYKDLFNIIKENNDKKIIMIIEEKDTKFENTFSKIEKYEDYKDETKILLDLTEDTIINKVSATLQGEEVILGTLLKDNKINELVDDKILSELVNTLSINIGESLKNLGEIENYYISRIFNRQIKIKKDFLKETSSFFVTYKAEITEQSIGLNKDIVLISDEDYDFHKICLNENYKTNNIHLLKEGDGQFIWQHSLGSLSRLHNFIDTRSINNYSEHEMINSNDNIVIISAEPGMGKSTVIIKLAEQIKKSNPYLWVQCINLSDQINHLHKMKLEQDQKKDEAIKMLLKMVNPKPGLDEELFKRRIIEDGKIVLLFDGFDEISPRHNDNVIELLNVLKNTKVVKMWITTRPHMRRELEDKLGVISYTLKPLTRENQVIFLKKFWNERLGLDIVLDNRFDSYICKLLDLLKRSITDKELEFTGVPLQTRMLAEVFEDDFNSYHNSKKEEPNLPKRIDLVDLYQKLIDKKLIIHSQKPKDKQERVFSFTFIRKHKLLAINLIFNHDLNVLLSKKEKTDLKIFIEVFKKGKEKSGFVNQIINDIPSFIHRTFAEYFSALWFAEKLQENNLDIKNFLLEHIFKKEYELLQIFLDRILTKDDEGETQCRIHNAVLNNDESEVNSLLDALMEEIEFLDKGGRTALHLAAAYGYESILKILLDNSKKEESIFNNKIDMKDDIFNWSAIMYAVKSNYWNIVELLLQNGAESDDIFKPNSRIDIGIVNDRKETLLHIAAKKDYVKFAEVLIKNGVKVHSKDTNHSTPLHVAAETGNYAVMEVILKHSNSHNVNCDDIYGRTPLYKAAENGQIKVLELLFDSGANINANNASAPSWGAKNWSILHIAAYVGHKEIVEFLINKQVDINVQDSNGRDALYISINQGKEEITKLLDKTGDSLVFIYTSLGKLELVEGILKNKPKEERKRLTNPTHVGKRGPLHLAANNGYLGIVELLVNNGADIKTFATDGFTPLHMSASEGHQEIVEFLINEILKNEGNFDILELKEDLSGWTVLHSAAKSGHTKIVEHIIEKFSEDKTIINVADSKGTTLLQTASYHGNLDTVKFLIENKANINAVDIFGATPLFSAAVSNNYEVVKYILEQKETRIYCDLEKLLGMLDITPLHLAAAYDNLDMAILMDSSRVDAGEKSSLTPLHVASLFDSTKVIEYLLDKKANTDAVINFSNVIQILNFLKQDFKGGFGSKVVDYVMLLKYLLKIPYIGNGISKFISSQFTPKMICLALKYNNQLVQNYDNSQRVHWIVSFILSFSWIEKQLKMMKDYVQSKNTSEPAPPIGAGSLFYDILNKTRN